MHEVDPAAVRAAAAGDLDAFEQLVRAYQTPVWRYLRGVVGDGDAEDLAQETFIRAHAKIGTFGFRSSFATWLFSVAHNVAVDALRSRSRRERAMQLRVVPVDDAGPALATEVAAALAALSPKLREALVLVEVIGLSCEEAGAVLGIPSGTVKSRLFNARRQAVAWFSAGEEVAQ